VSAAGLLALAVLFASCAGPGHEPVGAAADPGGDGAGGASAAERAASERAAGAVLDALHEAASRADGEHYFALFAPDAVFLGTDATERWSIEQFKAYAAPYFARGQGWTYVPVERHVAVSARGDVAWFDERLTNGKYGEVRGSGVLVRLAEQWRIAQYNLSLPIPNDLAADFVARIRAQGR